MSSLAAPVQALPNNGGSAPAPSNPSGTTNGLPNVNPAQNQALVTPQAPTPPSPTMDAGAIASGQTTPSFQFPTKQTPPASTAASEVSTNNSIQTPQTTQQIIAQE